MTAMKIAWIVFIITLIACLITLGVLPADTQIPVHWNIDGDIDQYRSLAYGLLMYPSIMLIVLLAIHSMSYNPKVSLE